MYLIASTCQVISRFSPLSRGFLLPSPVEPLSGPGAASVQPRSTPAISYSSPTGHSFYCSLAQALGLPMIASRSR
jgi:hypothetical protein